MWFVVMGEKRKVSIWFLTILIYQCYIQVAGFTRNSDCETESKESFRTLRERALRFCVISIDLIAEDKRMPRHREKTFNFVEDLFIEG